MDITLTAVFEEVSAHEGGGYTAYVEELPGAISEGDTLDEARDNLRDAVELLLETNRTLNGAPRPGTRVTRESLKSQSREALRFDSPLRSEWMRSCA